MEHYRLFIDGEFVEAQSGKRTETNDPGTGEPVATVARAGPEDASAAVEAARRSFDKGDWSGMDPGDRARVLYDFADQITRQALRLALTESMDAGQVIGLAKYWGMLGSQLLRNLGHYAARHFPWQEEIPYSGNVFAPGRDYIRREPVGVCAGIIPWNFPLMMALWKIVQAVSTGNSIVLKPASTTPLTGLIAAEAARDAGVPRGVINVVPGGGGEIGDLLCTHPQVDKIAFTGSTQVGKRIMRLASDSVKRVTLELGGKSANIVLDDADLDMAAHGAAFGTYFHQGQMCEAGTRVLVSSRIYDEFVQRLRKRTQELRVGYQLSPDSHLGPLINEQQLQTVQGYVDLGLQEGAELVCGGRRVEPEGLQGGCYYAPTLFAGVDNRMRIAREEIFGPVVSVIPFDTDEEAVELANDSDYGLAGGVFSNSTARAERIARGMRTGTVWINNFHAFGDFCPFGGYKQSGLGRELGEAGLKEYTETKRIHVSSFPAPESNFTMSVLSDATRISMGQYNCPTNVLSGRRCLDAAYKEMVDLGCRRALIVTDKGVHEAGLDRMVQEALADFAVGVFDEVPQDPDLETVDRATETARRLGADCVVSVGGGSVMDTAKGACVTLKNGGRANDHVAMFRLREPQTPHIAVPTTAGSGSEVTNMAVLKSPGADRKVYILDNHVIPNTAILDPRMTRSLPGRFAASTAMDALTHAVEALTSVMAQPICDGQALHAIRLIREHLPRVISGEGGDAERNTLQIAATMAGWAFSVAQVGLAHGMSHTLGMHYGVAHGAACGILLPHVMRFNLDYAADKLAQAAQALGASTGGMSQREAAQAAADSVEDLMREVGHPLRLRDLGIPEDEDMGLPAMHALADPATLFNARPVHDPQQVQELYHQAL
jgi:acyl-CoA reductase-like NAD-dependent aldehyde dehydrogenase/alcohol dehydrogenase class IV